MKPQIVHRYTIPLQAAIEQLLGMEAADGEAFQVTVEDDELVVDIIEPASTTNVDTDVAHPPPPETSTQAESPPEKPKGGPLAQRAAIMCGERGFWTFIGKRYGVTIASADDAGSWMKAQCGVASRVEFDHNGAKADNFREIDKLYRLWLEGFD
ncbi:hypothetical protein EN875_032400 [Mesorhizobium sp. M2D.F.Ca.ET.232.01.1.1]|uniref:hypothetical protein n=1 Tax=Mesorhizobium sp. M2D.F.Ca.ET.232.01.1.1 TaxID=2496670 RepID=UPI000FCB357E|nr:hypothetical protein [Mesorhizobium sp. M2D.F.Ca.ET.232.01.1.1]TGP28258.1 hypothetical protein EN875_032400 [Mesorhizobium sp. M2D.F.Ca.ET.232.01.1.1]